ncbi:hypothetical protein IAT38_007894 [Cryptococcus sp. DSM 104549]
MSTTTTTRRSPFSLSLSPLLIVLLLLVLAFAAVPADAGMAPVYMHYYCRQQCEQRFKMCAMGAISGPRLASPIHHPHPHHHHPLPPSLHTPHALDEPLTPFPVTAHPIASFL